MYQTKHTIKRTALATAMAATIGTVAIPEQLSAANLSFTLSGWFTMLNPAGTDALVNGDSTGAPMYGRRTPVMGTMTFDTTTNSGTMSLQPFSFFGSGDAAATNITFEDVDGPGGASTLMVGNMGFDWNNNIGIPVSIVWDGQGIMDAINTGLTVGDTIGATSADFACDSNISCSVPATDNFLFNFGKFSYTLPIGASPVVTTTFNTTDIGTIVLGTNPSGTLPLIADTVGGSPMKAGPFPGFNANFDFDNMTLTSDGSGSITAPADVNLNVPETPPPPRTTPADLGTATNVTPPATAEYCTAGDVATCDSTNAWVADNGTNTISVPVTQTVNVVNVDWRAGGGSAFDSQVVTVTVNDTIPPTLTAPPDVSASVTKIDENVCFGAATASDVWDSAPKIEYSINSLANWQPASSTDNCSTQFGPNANTVNWRATDTAGNVSTPVSQTVTLVLPAGIIGKACTVDLNYAGFRNLDGTFIMRDPTGAQVGSDDDTVTGKIDTTLLCTDPVCSEVGASLVTDQPFQGLLWTADPITLYGPGDWTFETCLPDGSTQCTPPTPIGMTVNQGQLGAHMLFAWGNTQNIDVVVVWDVDCGKQQLTTTDPASPTDPNQPDGILGTSMVDGPFKGFNAAFDLSATGVDPQGNPVPLIADGGYLVDIPAYKNPVDGSSPLPLTYTVLSASQLPPDSAVQTSCMVGGCFEFVTDGVNPGSDANGNYQYAQVVLPLTGPIPWYSLYRKILDPANGSWMTFINDSRNTVMSAQRDTATGFCPEPGAGDYSVADFNSNLANMLQPDDECIQLTIEDNGPYDSDPRVGFVGDPGGVGQTTTAQPKPDAKTSGDGGCSISTNVAAPQKHFEWGLLGGLLALLGFSGYRRRRRQY